MSSVYALPSEITLINDPSVIKIAIEDNQEPLVDLSQQKLLGYGPSPEIPNNKNYTFMRKTVYEKLKRANANLPKGIHFCLYEGYRSLALQKKIFEELYNKVRARHPDWSLGDLFKETTKLASPVVNQDGSINIPPHSTGGAIDVYLVDEQGRPLEMGIHPKDWMSDADGVLSLTHSTIISAKAKANRELMGKLLSDEGFVNYPTEYWHWSYGDRYWAFMKKRPLAIYGSVADGAPN